MQTGHPVRKYQFSATLREGVVEWTFGVQTDDGVDHIVPIRDGEEVPVLRDICRHDGTIYFDGESRTLRTGWNVPGKQDKL
jgi:hypothetical protein